MTGDQAISRRMVPTAEGHVTIKSKLTRCRQRGGLSYRNYDTEEALTLEMTLNVYF